MKKIIFFHIGKMGNYQAIFSDMYRKIESCGILNHIDKLVLMHYGDGEINLPPSSEKIMITQGLLIEPSSEFISLSNLKLVANTLKSNDENAYLGYIHTKGTFSDDRNGLRAITDWRNFMLHFAIERYKDVFKLLDENDTCGVDLRCNPGLHYSGNFWWARSDYVASLPEFLEAPIEGAPSPRHRAEFYIASNSNARHFSMGDSGIGVYERALREYPTERYKNGCIQSRWRNSIITISET